MCHSPGWSSGVQSLRALSAEQWIISYLRQRVISRAPQVRLCPDQNGRQATAMPLAETFNKFGCPPSGWYYAAVSSHCHRKTTAAPLAETVIIVCVLQVDGVPFSWPTVGKLEQRP